MLSSSISHLMDLVPTFKKPTDNDPEIESPTTPSPVVETVKLLAATLLGSTVIAGLLYGTGTGVAYTGILLANKSIGAVSLSGASNALISLGTLVAQIGSTIFAPAYTLVYKLPRWTLEQALPYTYFHVRVLANTVGSLATNVLAKLPSLSPVVDYIVYGCNWLYKEVIVASLKIVNSCVQDVIKHALAGLVYLAASSMKLGTRAWDVSKHVISYIAAEVILPGVRNALSFLSSVFNQIGTKAYEINNYVLTAWVQPALTNTSKAISNLYQRIVPAATVTEERMAEEGLNLATNLVG